MNWRCAARCSTPKFTLRTEKNPTRSSNLRGIIGMSASPRRCRRGNAGLGSFDLDVIGECDRALYERPALVDRAADGGELRDRRCVQTRYVDDRCAVAAVCLDIEDRDDRRVVGVLHRAIDRQRCVRGYRERRRAEYYAVAVTIPPERTLAEFIAAVVAEAAAGCIGILGSGASVPADEQHVSAKLVA